jgi:hypothetical protein
MLDPDCMEWDMHCTDKSMFTMPRPKEILQRVKSIKLLGPYIQCNSLVQKKRFFFTQLSKLQLINFWSQGILGVNLVCFVP